MGGYVAQWFGLCHLNTRWFYPGSPRVLGRASDLTMVAPAKLPFVEYLAPENIPFDCPGAISQHTRSQFALVPLFHLGNIIVKLLIIDCNQIHREKNSDRHSGSQFF